MPPERVNLRILAKHAFINRAGVQTLERSTEKVECTIAYYARLQGGCSTTELQRQIVRKDHIFVGLPYEFLHLNLT